MARRTEGPRGARVALNLRLPPAVVRRLKLHALASGESAGAVVARLVAEFVPDYEIVPRPAGGPAG